MARPAKPAEVGPWAKDKLHALNQYLDYYTKVLKNQSWRLVYVDAFSGGGTAAVRMAKRSDDSQSPLIVEASDPEEQEFIRGSPRIALELNNPFDTYVFIDANGARIAELQAITSEFGAARNIHLRPGHADEQIAWVLQQNIRKATHRGVAFLDPFGAHLSWSSVKGLADTGLFEVLVNFPLHMAIVRLMKNDAKIAASDRNQLDGFFGNGDWEKDVYETRSDLLETIVCKRPDYIERLLQRYRVQLKSAFGHVSEPKLIRNTKNSPLYYLLWAGPHRKGLQGANYILGMGERLASGPRGGSPTPRT
jgi:three-Cys-motif partner protein